MPSPQRPWPSLRGAPLAIQRKIVCRSGSDQLAKATEGLPWLAGLSSV